MTIKVENETHWRTSDIKRILQGALTVAGVDPSETVEVDVCWTGPQSKVIMLESGKNPRMTIGLPRRGPKDPHRIPMMALALAAVHVPEGVMVLPLAESFRVANLVAYNCVKSRQYQFDAEHLEPIVEAAMSQDMPPKWETVEFFLIQKYADPLKDGTYLDFVKDKRRAIARADQDVARAEQQVEAAQGRLKKAQARKKAAERSLQAARARRTTA
jgi:hypothetical protein